MSDDGIVIVLDFTRDDAVESRDQLTHSHRSTTSSRRPGRAIEGTVVSFTRRIVVCALCLRKRMDFDGPHSLLNTDVQGVQRDCIGRLWRDGKLLEGRV